MLTQTILEQGGEARLVRALPSSELQVVLLASILEGVRCTDLHFSFQESQLFQGEQKGPSTWCWVPV